MTASGAHPPEVPSVAVYQAASPHSPAESTLSLYGSVHSARVLKLGFFHMRMDSGNLLRCPAGDTTYNTVCMHVQDPTEILAQSLDMTSASGKPSCPQVSRRQSTPYSCKWGLGAGGGEPMIPYWVYWVKGQCELSDHTRAAYPTVRKCPTRRCWVGVWGGVGWGGVGWWDPPLYNP